MQAALNIAVLNRVTRAVRETGYLSDDVPVTPETRFDDLGFDSLEFVELAIRLEETFDVEFPADFVGHRDAVSDVVRYVSRRFFRDVAAEDSGIRSNTAAPLFANQAEP